MSPSVFVCLEAAIAMYAASLGLVLGWCGWSVGKHGWRKGGLRRASYVLFGLLLAVRVAWCAVLLAGATAADTGDALDGRSLDERLLSAPVSRLLDGTASALQFAVLSLLVSGWADSHLMMSASSAMAPVTVRPAALFYRLWPTYAAVNTAHAAVLAVSLTPLLLPSPTHRHHPDRPESGDGDTEPAGWPHTALVGGERLGLGASAAFSLALAVASLVAGLSVSCKMVAIVAIEPSLRSYTHLKARKVSTAAAVFFLCCLLRSFVLFSAALAGERHPGPASRAREGVSSQHPA